MVNDNLTHLERVVMSLKKLGFFTLIVMFSSISNLVSAEENMEVGSIKGEVDYCGSGPKDRLRIYIPGRQFSITTGSDGKFLFQSIPAGTYSLGFEIDNQFIGEKKDVAVKPGEITDLGPVAICPDMDSVSDESIIPKLKVDKDKIGVCRDGYQGIIMVANGRAQCDKGTLSRLECNKNYDNCDKDINNGCEADLMQDDENCGRCGNICNLEICTLGSC